MRLNQLTVRAIAILLAATLAGAGFAQQVRVADPMRGIDLEQKLDAQVPLDTPFKDDSGRDVRLGDYFGAKPVILNLIFYKCPGICLTEMDGMIRAFNRLKFQIGREFEVVTISIDPREGPPLAAFKKGEYKKLYKRQGVDEGWHFLTGTDANIHRVADAVGFKYVYDQKRGLYNHPAGLIVLTPQGKTSRYLYGTEYTSTNLSFALMDASKGRIGSFVEKVLRSCYEYDPEKGHYGIIIIRVMQLAGISTVIVLSAFLFLMFRWEKRRGYHLPYPPGEEQPGT